MDPISALIALWLVAVFMTTRLPGLLTESRDGEISEAYAARLKRIEQAGVAPAAGSPLRRLIGNAWRDFLIGREGKRVTAVDPAGPSWGSTVAGKAYARWRDRHAVDDPAVEPADSDSVDETPHDSPVDQSAADDPQPHDDQPATTDTPDPDAPFETETVEDTATWDPPSDPNPVDDPRDDPIRVESTAGDPIPDPPKTSAQPQLEGADMTTAVARGGEVTGVVSGAAEARAIQAQVEAIRDAYNAALRQLGQRIVNLGEQAMANVELRSNGPVVASIAQAAEACAAAIAHANGSAAEVVGALQVVKAGFNRLNS